ncbi:MAG: hypothetical protein KA250_05510 [Verrucomicrobiales bacterium]|nr:hypothetical protein [Verrucomicrobiales bacterium]MBP9223343.1 hypothetical protein [Verrucomicrobiales bacterium]HQZ27562.1 hypothetical protein [Verrucomicrobiales bacterium]
MSLELVGLTDEPQYLGRDGDGIWQIEAHEWSFAQKKSISQSNSVGYYPILLDPA